MTNTTTDYWSVDGTSRETLGWGLDYDGSLFAPPPTRGGSQTVPYRPGVVWRPRIADSRVLTFPMWLSTADADGVEGGEAQLLDNWAALRDLFWGAPDRQMSVVKRWNGGYSSATALGSFAGGIEPINRGMQVWRFTADIELSDPYFYGASATLLNAAAIGTHDITGDVLGDVASSRYVLSLTGALTNPTITVKAGSTVLSTLTYSGSITSTKTLAITFPAKTFTTGDTGAYPAKFTAGQTEWLNLHPSATSIVIGGTGAGTVTLTHEPAYL